MLSHLAVRSLQSSALSASIATRALLPCLTAVPSRLDLYPRFFMTNTKEHNRTPFVKKSFFSSTPSTTENVIILGAAGRDFHDFITYWSTKPNCNVKAFTGAQIPGIENRRFPPEMCNNDKNGNKYPQGIQIHPESSLEELIEATNANTCTMAYSDLPYDTVQGLAARSNAAGCNFVQLAPNNTMIESSKPIVAITASRTGVGKSQSTRYIASYFKSKGLRVAAVRHPMPYDKDLNKQRCEVFRTMEDMDKYNCTIEEREEYYGHIKEGTLLFAGVDYPLILREAEKEADIILWDGGNNDFPFFKPDLHITLVDSLRPTDEEHYYPGEINVRMADLILVTKVNMRDSIDIQKADEHAKHLRKIIKSDTPVLYGASIVKPGLGLTTIEANRIVQGKKVLVIDDGPTLTHGGMPFGAGYVLAQDLGASEIVDPRPYAQGSLKNVFEKFQHLHNVLPAMGYGESQVHDLEATIKATPCDAVVIGTPSDISHVVNFDNRPTVTAQYDLKVLPQHSKQFDELLDSVTERYEKNHPVVA